MKFNSNSLLEGLQADVRQLILTVSFLQKEDPELLISAPTPGRWSVVQVLEHLNSYGRYYLPAVAKSLQSNKTTTENFASGWFGNYFTKIMRPGADGKIGNKMSSPKNHRPPERPDIRPVFDEFMNQQQQLLDLLDKAKEKNIGAIRTPISISRFIKLKVGDTFRFLIAHEQRHFVQIANTIGEVQRVIGKFQSIPQAIQRSPVFSHD